MKSPRTMRILVLPSQVVSCLTSVDVLRATTASSAIDDFSSTTLSALIVVCGARLKTLANALSARCSRSLAGRRRSLEPPQNEQDERNANIFGKDRCWASRVLLDRHEVLQR